MEFRRNSVYLAPAQSLVLPDLKGVSFNIQQSKELLEKIRFSLYNEKGALDNSTLLERYNVAKGFLVAKACPKDSQTVSRLSLGYSSYREHPRQQHLGINYPYERYDHDSEFEAWQAQKFIYPRSSHDNYHSYSSPLHSWRPRDYRTNNHGYDDH
jgi:hypothetical protein